MPNKLFVATTRRHAGTVLASFVLTTALVAGAGCAPSLEQRARLADNRYDSLVERTAHDSSPGWRADHFATLDLHGPFARPKLAAGADTNDAAAYFNLGSHVEWKELGLADRAFYWAIRLDPTMADAYYARWEVRRRGWHFRLYDDGSVRSVLHRSPNDTVTLDSLRDIALMYDPFLPAAMRISGTIAVLDEMQADRNAVTSGLRAYTAGDYAKAVFKLGIAIREKPENAGLHVVRAFAWLHLSGKRDSAIADLTALIDHIEHIQDSTVGPYVSKHYLYYAIGFLRTGQSRYTEARAAYESALAENLGFYMAHVRLSAIDFTLGDTAAALTELETASLIRTDDPILLTFRGQILVEQHRLDDAERELRAAVHADTDFALPYSFLGQLGEERNDTTGALRSYREYLARASHSAPERTWVDQRISHLTRPTQ